MESHDAEFSPAARTPPLPCMRNATITFKKIAMKERYAMAESTILCWLRVESGLRKEAKRIAENPDNEFEYGDHELAEVLYSWLFSRDRDGYLVDELGMSPGLRDQVARKVGVSFHEVRWEKIREILIEED